MFAYFYGINTQWPVSVNQCEVIESRAGKINAMSPYQPAPAHSKTLHTPNKHMFYRLSCARVDKQENSKS